MHESIRKQILSMTIGIRKWLESDISHQLESTYGMNADGAFVPVGKMPTMLRNPVLARERQDLEAAVEHEHKRSPHMDKAGALLQFAREVAFTYLNRLAALRMMEARDLIKPSIGEGMDSNGFKQFQALFGLVTESKEEGYRRYLELLLDEVATELPTLFDRSLPTSILFPSALALRDVMEELNKKDLTEIWLEDETIGWIYQYFTPKEQRDQARAESAVPRNSYELSFRNQFYTPAYVVKFLTDNTLGRLWFEMNQKTKLVELCEFMVRRPGEEFNRKPRKDPKELRVLDPACGSGHFLLYAFDLLAAIYEEEGCAPAEIPGLILAQNLYGIDIDLRATQITSLALYLKAKKYHPEAKVRSTNIVCAEPMPGEESLFEEFLETVKEPMLRSLAKAMWKEFELAGEAGSLLKAEVALQEVLEKAKKAHEASYFTSGTSADFWETAEEQLVSLLNRYADQALQGASASRRLFARDGLEGLRLLEVLRSKFDVVLMNPPFGEPACDSVAYLNKHYRVSKHDLACAFVERGLGLLQTSGVLGAITSRTPFFLDSSSKWRNQFLLKNGRIGVLADLGFGVLDTAMVETAAYTVSSNLDISSFFRLLMAEEKEKTLQKIITETRSGKASPLHYSLDSFEFNKVPGQPFSYWVPPILREAFRALPSLKSIAAIDMGMSTKNDPRFVRLRWEVDPEDIGFDKKWAPYAKGGDSGLLAMRVDCVVLTENGFAELKTDLLAKYPYLKGNTDWVLHPEYHYGSAGLSFGRRVRRFGVSPLRKGCYFSDSNPTIFPHDFRDLLPLAALLNSDVVRGFLGMVTSVRKMEVGYVGKIPVPPLTSDHRDRLEALAYELLELSQQEWFADERSPLFRCPILLTKGAEPSARMRAILEEVNLIARDAYGIDPETFNTMRQELAAYSGLTSDREPSSEDEAEALPGSDEEWPSLLSYAIGCIVGRWDARDVYHQGAIRPTGDPFDPIPPCPPGMLLDPSTHLPPRQLPEGYPVHVQLDGIIPHDPDHPHDMTNLLDGILHYLWPHDSNLYANLLDGLHTKDLRLWVTNEFFRYHASRYSLSMRKAPIYWQLVSTRKRYGLWFYYPKLSKDTLFLALREYAEPKLASETGRLEQLKRSALTAKSQVQLDTVRNLTREITTQEELVQEIAAFRDELKSVADAGYDPDLNDGVLINIAPLHKLVPWKEAAACYKELKTGKYPWATIHQRYKFR